MARIVGFAGVTPDPSSSGARLLDTMCAGFRLDKRWTTRKLATEAFSGWAGVGRLDGSSISRVIDSHDCLISSVGRIYNIPEPGRPEEHVAAAYREHGPEAFRRFEGDLSCVLYDKRSDTLYVVRDRFGSNLLFHARIGDGIVVASEIKALFAAGVAPVPNRTTIWRYLFGHYRYAYGTEDTFFEGVQLLAPNTILGVRGGDVVYRGPVWSYELDAAAATLSDREAIDRFHALLERSLDRREADLSSEPAYFVSGGLDSPTVAALAARRRKARIAAFTIGYDDEHTPAGELAYDERAVASTIVEHHGMRWHVVIPRPTDFETVFEEMLARHDEPISSPTWFAHFQLSRAVAEAGFTVAFGGDGGDHALAGLYDDYPYYFADLHHAGDHARLDHELSRWQELHDHPAFPKNREVWNVYRDRCFDWDRPGTITGYSWDEERMRGAPGYDGCAHPAMASFRGTLPHFPSHSQRYLTSKLIQDLLYSSSPPSSRAEDLNLETFGVELRSAMLDLDFIRFCWNLPGHLLIRDGWAKYLIRAAMKGLLPDGVLWKREHVGLNAPFNVWVRGPLRGLFERTVASDIWSRTEILDVAALRTLYAEHVSQQRNHMMFLWRVFSLEQWLAKLPA